MPIAAEIGPKSIGSADLACVHRLIATDSIQKDEADLGAVFCLFEHREVPYLQMIESYARVGQPEGESTRREGLHRSAFGSF